MKRVILVCALVIVCTSCSAGEPVAGPAPTPGVELYCDEGDYVGGCVALDGQWWIGGRLIVRGLGAKPGAPVRVYLLANNLEGHGELLGDTAVHHNGQWWLEATIPTFLTYSNDDCCPPLRTQAGRHRISVCAPVYRCLGGADIEIFEREG